MKKINKTILFSVLAFTIMMEAASCKKNFLDPNAQSIYIPDNSFNSASGLISGIEAAGRVMWVENFCNSDNSDAYNAQLFFSDMAVSGATDATGSKNFMANLSPDATDVTGWYYSNSYAGIKNANTVINYIDLPKWDTTQVAQRTQRNSILGMAYFWRAYYYYYLVNCYGDVPWVGELAKTPRLNFNSTTRVAILKKIKQDLQFAASWVPDGVNKGLPTKGAALHLLTKVNLALNDFDGAITTSTQLISGGAYQLMTSRFGTGASDATKNVIWDLHNPDNKSLPANKEGILMVINRASLVGNLGAQFWIRNAGPFWGANINTPNGNKGTSDAVGIAIDQNSAYGRGVAFARLTWYGSHIVWGQNTNSANDLRHAKPNWQRMEDFVYNAPALVGKDSYYNKPLQKYSASGALLVSDTIRSWFDYPTKLFVYNPLTATSTQYGGYSDAYIFRIAETYLLRAEANVWKGNQSAALADINIVRARAGATPLTGTITIGTILDERARELSFEEERKIELTRMAYTFAQTGVSAPTGVSYNMANFSTSNFWYDWLMQKSDFYNKNVKTGLNVPYTMSPYMVLWPIPTSALVGNTAGVINQNQGYKGAENNVPPLTTIP